MADHAIEAPIRERRQILRVTLHVRDPSRIGDFVLACVTQHLPRYVDAGHGRAEAGEQPRILPLAACEREYVTPRNVSDELRKNGIREPDPVRVEDATVPVRDFVICRWLAVGHRSLISSGAVRDPHSV